MQLARTPPPCPTNSEKQYYEKELQANQNNLKKTWQLLKTAINCQSPKTSTISNIQFDGQLNTDPKTMATLFNQFFTSMPGSIVNDLHTTDPLDAPDFASGFFADGDDNLDNMPCLNFGSLPVTSHEILEATKLLLPKTLLDHNGVSIGFIKQFIHILMTPLQHVIQLSLNQGMVPVQLKIAKVIPIYKSGDKSKMDNYQPISLLSNFSKILEKIVATRLMDHLESNKVLSESKCGFRKNHFTLHPLVHFMHALAIFCDLL
jgi:hypothetical protein